MNLELCKFWGVSSTMEEENWQELYAQKLFDLKKVILEQVYLPRLIRKRLEDCERIIRLDCPDKHFVVLDNFELMDLHSFEIKISEVKLAIHRSADFEDLFIGLHQLLLTLEAYKGLIEDYTRQWGDDWKLVEVNSREVFPSGLFLQSLKEGKTISDWREPLLKERKRITIVF